MSKFSFICNNSRMLIFEKKKSLWEGREETRKTFLVKLYEKCCPFNFTGPFDQFHHLFMPIGVEGVLFPQISNFLIMPF